MSPSSLLRVVFAPAPLAVPFLVLLVLVALPALLSALRRDRLAQIPLLILFVASMAAVLLAQTVAAFAIAWETMALAGAFLVATHHDRRAVRRAAFSYAIVGQVGAACILTALALLAAHAGSAGFAEIARAAPSLDAGIRSAVVLLAIAGFGSKAGLLPLHFWLSRAHPVAPAAASALLSGVMLKIAIYGLLLVCFVLAPQPGIPLAIVITAAGLISALAGAIYAAVETDFKRLLAFSSVENIGIITAALGFSLLAAAFGRPLLAALAFAALIYHALAHGVFKSALFLGAGEIADAAHTTDLEHLGGLMRTLRFSAPAILVACLAAASLPPLSGFASEWLLLQAFIRAFAHAPRVLQGVAAGSMLILGSASGIAAIAFANAFGTGILGTGRSAHPRRDERFGAPALALVWLASCTVALGVASPWLLQPVLALALAVTGGHTIGAVAAPPVWIAAFPIAGAAAALVLARVSGFRRAAPWTCGSQLTLRAQYTATAFGNPLRVLLGGLTQAHVDGAARTFAAFVQHAARRTRIVQGGYVRIYLAYALAALIAVLVIAR